VQALCFAFITSSDSTIGKKNAKLLVKLSRGIPGLLTRLLSLAADALYRSSILWLAERKAPGSDTLCKSMLKPSHYVQQIQQKCLELALKMEDMEVMSLVVAVRTECPRASCQQCNEFRTHAMPFPLAASIAHRNRSIFTSPATVSAQVGPCAETLWETNLRTFRH
jgi:hypothetical protein